MPGPWADLDNLIRELGEISSLPHAAVEPSLGEATIAVSKATELLTRASQGRGRRRSDKAAQDARRAIDEARAALSKARVALLRAQKAAPDSGETVAAAPAAPIEERTDEVRCPACEEVFSVTYVVSDAPFVAMPLACPRDDCDGITAVELPAGVPARVTP